ncbi:YfbK domain-containing protein [Bradyrhizobium japonicum]
MLVRTPVDRASEHGRFEDAPLDARFATSVAAFGEILRGGKHTGRFGYDDVLRIASAARGDDPYGYRSEFLQLVRAAKLRAQCSRCDRDHFSSLSQRTHSGIDRKRRKSCLRFLPSQPRCEAIKAENSCRHWLAQTPQK